MERIVPLLVTIGIASAVNLGSWEFKLSGGCMLQVSHPLRQNAILSFGDIIQSGKGEFDR